MKAVTAIILVLAIVILASGNRLVRMFGEAGFIGVGVFATMVCLIWGCYIFPRYRILAWCCLIAATLLSLDVIGFLFFLNNIDPDLRKM